MQNMLDMYLFETNTLIEQLDGILNAVNSQYGLRSKAQGIVCAIPVERAFKI